LLEADKKTSFKTCPDEKHGFNFRRSTEAKNESFKETVAYFSRELN
jgi:hypothetical protein